MTDETPKEGELILYRTTDDAVRLEVLYTSGELQREPTFRKILRVQREGNREVRREIEIYNLDAIVSVGYRVNSTQATQFRIWATQTLRESIVQTHAE